MTNFEAMGEARLLAAKGQRQFATAAVRALARALDWFCRHIPANKVHPW